MPKFLALIMAFVPMCVVQGGCGDATSPCEDTPELPPRNAARVSVTQGLWGDVWFWEGDFMPTCPSGSVVAVGREMRIHELASLSDVVRDGFGAFYSQVNTSLVATVWSDADGFFQAALPPGQYSVFSVEDSLLYANGFDGVGHIFPVEVKDGEVTGVTFNITYLAYE